MWGQSLFYFKSYSATSAVRTDAWRLEERSTSSDMSGRSGTDFYTLGALVSDTTAAVLKAALESVPTTTGLMWCHEKLGKTVQATRRTLFAAQRKAEQKQDQFQLAA